MSALTGSGHSRRDGAISQTTRTLSRYPPTSPTSSASTQGRPSSAYVLCGVSRSPLAWRTNAAHWLNKQDSPTSRRSPLRPCRSPTTASPSSCSPLRALCARWLPRLLRCSQQRGRSIPGKLWRGVGVGRLLRHPVHSVLVHHRGHRWVGSAPARLDANVFGPQRYAAPCCPDKLAALRGHLIGSDAPAASATSCSSAELEA